MEAEGSRERSFMNPVDDEEGEIMKKWRLEKNDLMWKRMKSK